MKGSTLFDGWQPTDAVQGEGLDGLRRHYTGLSEKYGFSVQIPLYYILRVTYFYSASSSEEDNQKASELVKFAINRDAASIDDFVELIEALNNQGEQQGAQRLTAFLCAYNGQHKLCSKTPK